MDVEIRHSTPDDIPAIARVTFESAWASRSYGRPPDLFSDEDRLRADFDRFPQVWSLVAESNGALVAHVALIASAPRGRLDDPTPGLGHLWRLFVHPDEWGSGLASDLLGRAQDEMRARGYTAARLFTPKAQARARAFYEREGWRPTGQEIYSDDLDLELVEYCRDL